MNTIIGTKIDQTQRFLENGTRVPVTVIAVADNPVVQVKTMEKDHYSAVQLGFGTKKKANKALTGHLKKANIQDVPHFLREVRLADDDTLQAGDMVKLVDVLKPGDIVKVTGVSKGKGWAGGVKRYGFKGGPRTHGQSDRERAPGSIGQTTTPGRVYKGKRMAGRMGQDTVSISNLVVIAVNGTQLLVSGLVPGSRKNIVVIEKTGEVKEKKFVPLHESSPEAVKDEPVVEDIPAEEAVAQEQIQAESQPAVQDAGTTEPVKTEETGNVVKSEAQTTDAPAIEETKIEETPKEEVASDAKEAAAVPKESTAGTTIATETDEQVVKTEGEEK